MRNNWCKNKRDSVWGLFIHLFWSVQECIFTAETRPKPDHGTTAVTTHPEFNQKRTDSPHISIYIIMVISYRTVCLSNIALFSKSIKIHVDSWPGWTLVFEPLFGLTWGAKEEQSQLQPAYKCSYKAFFNGCTWVSMSIETNKAS